MKCPRCQHENETAAKFCEECAAPLARSCDNCGRQVSPTAKFCPECAHPTGRASATPPADRFASPESYTPKHLAEKILTSKTALEGERKQVTVLFADLKGSMELLADRDPEEARKLLDPVLERMMEAVHRYEGTVNQVMGDGIMALFGAPLAHEDHAVRACYAALRMQEAVRRYSDELRRAQGVEVQIRVGAQLRRRRGALDRQRSPHGLHRRGPDHAPGGPHGAARGARQHPAHRRDAAPGRGLRPGHPARPGADQGARRAGRGVRAGGGRRRPHPPRGRGAAGAHALRRPDAELEQLRDALDRASLGHGQVVAVVGEPGVGKSRLFWELTHSHRVHGWLIVQSASVSYGKATAYLPVIELLRGYFAIESRDDPRKIREKVTGKVLTLAPALAPVVPALLALLDVPVDEASWQALDPLQRRQQTLDAVKRLLLARERGPAAGGGLRGPALDRRRDPDLAR